jgi:hypothetical protein
MAKRPATVPSKGTEKRGGYSGSKPAEEMGPPVKIPSAVNRPNDKQAQANGGPQK